jgi:hypothetical protein
MKLSALYIWKRVTALGYFGLESFLSTQELSDECILCIDPTSGDDTVPLAEAICKKYDKARIVLFEWPKESSNGSAIGIASNYALGHARGDWVLNVQADEVWPAKLTDTIKTLWPTLADFGYDALEFKVLHTEHNAQQFQGGGTWQRQLGAGYTHAVKMWKRCGCHRLSPDGWSVQAQGNDGKWSEHNLRLRFMVAESEKWPILHVHDFFKDTVLERRRVQAEELWGDTPHYGATYHAMLDGEGQWKGLFDSPKWDATRSPFEDLMPDYLRWHLGKHAYAVRWELLS